MDFDFKVAGHRLTKLTNCQSYSLFKRSSNTVTDLQHNVTLMLNMWRLRTYDFMHKNVFSHNPIKVQYLRNCPPSIGMYSKSDSGLRYCKFYSCPWCWNRKCCYRVFKKTETVLNNFPSIKLYMFFKEQTYPKNLYKKSPQLLTERCSQINNLCKKLTRRSSVKGGAAHSYIEPSLDGFNVITKLLIATTKTVELSEDLLFKFSSTSPSKVASSFGSYPLSFVKRGIAIKGFSYFLSNIPKHHRRLVLFGAFYGKGGNNHVRRSQP